MQCCTLLASAALIGLASACTSGSNEQASPQAVADTVDPTLPTQLPRTVLPTHYAIGSRRTPPQLTFDGKVAIDLEVLKPTARSCSTPPTSTFAQATLTGHRRAAAGRARSRIDADAQTATFAFARARARQLPARHRLHRQDRHPGQRPVRARLRQHDGKRARAVHPVRELRRAPLRPVLGRARLQGDVRPHARRAGGRRWRSATCRPRREATSATA